jgi:hypothetical protein
MVGSHHIWFGESYAPFFIAKNTLVFTLIVQRCSLFLLLYLAFVFRLDFCSDLVISLHQGEFRPLVYVGFPEKKLFRKGLNGVGKEKKFHAKKWYKKELV